jgi:hypothetical protein
LKRLQLLVSIVAAVCLSTCSKSTSPSAPTPQDVAAPPAPVAAPPTTLSGASGVLVGAGDIGFCGTGGADATSRLLDRIPGTVFTTGDNAYMSGTADEFRRCYEPAWGRHRARTRPVAGNHEYGSGGGAYFDYFGANAGPRGDGYYSYAVGSWNVIALNSEIPSGPASPQMTWLRGELSSRRSACTAVLWHRPLFTSGRNGDNPDMRDVWRTLYEFDVDLVINGHDHTYERFAPQDPNGRPDPTRGLRQFIVGTGGAPLYEFATVRANSEVRAAVWGVAVFTLSPGAYQWEFVPVDGATFTDAGSGTCH